MSRTKPAELLRLADVKQAGAAVRSNASASLWDLGDGVLGFEIHTRFKLCDQAVVELLALAPDVVSQGFRALVIGSDDETIFSAGADGAVFDAYIGSGDYAALDAFLRDGQEALSALRYSSFPVIAAACGLAMGGGLELMLHADTVVAHSGLRAGFPERWIGVIPGWGGVTQTLVRIQAQTSDVGRAANLAMGLIAGARILSDAQEAQACSLLRPTDEIIESRETLLGAAKQRALISSTAYIPPETVAITVPGACEIPMLEAEITRLASTGNLAEGEINACFALARIIAGGNAARGDRLPEAEIMRLEREAFMQLARTNDVLSLLAELRATGLQNRL